LLAEQWLNSAVFPNWHGSCKGVGITGKTSGQHEKGKIIMTNFSNQIVAALSSIALSAAFFAFAIAPASQSVLQSGVIA
jgi:hypothetical protein